MIFMHKVFPVFLCFLVFSSVVLGASEEAMSEQGIFESVHSIAGAFDWHSITRAVAVLVGLVVIALIVLRLSMVLTRPRVNNENLKKVKEEKQFKKIFSEKEEVLENLKKELAKE